MDLGSEPETPDCTESDGGAGGRSVLFMGLLTAGEGMHESTGAMGGGKFVMRGSAGTTPTMDTWPGGVRMATEPGLTCIFANADI